MAIWGDEETLKLIAIWGEDAIQTMLEGSKRNKDMFKKIAIQMKDAGYDKTADQCNSKIRKLKLEYRKKKDGKKKTGTGRKDWRFFDATDDVLGHKPAMQPPVVVESGEATVQTDIPEEDEQSVAEGVGDSKSDESEIRSRSETHVIEVDKGKTPVTGKKRKKSGDNMNKMETLVEKVMKMQNESEQHYLRLEEKMMEMEEQRQKEDRGFQLQMMKMCNQQSYHPMYSFMQGNNNTLEDY